MNKQNYKVPCNVSSLCFSLGRVEGVVYEPRDGASALRYEQTIFGRCRKARKRTLKMYKTTLNRKYFAL